MNKTNVDIKKANGEYIHYDSSRNNFELYSRVDLVVTNLPIPVVKQFNLKTCYYYDMKNNELLMTSPDNTCQRMTTINNTERNSHLVSYFWYLADGCR